MNATTPTILNPDIYLNFLTPSIAADYEISRNVYLVTLGALLWDILSSIPEDWQILRSSRLCPALFAYFIARPSVLVLVVLAVLEKTGPIANCGPVALAVSMLWVIASASSSYLFLKRIHAVFSASKVVCRLFTLLWLGGIGAACLSLPGPLRNYYEIQGTKHCINRRIGEYVFAAFTVPLLFDALVFLAITYKLLSSHRTGKKMGWRTFCSGEALPRLSKAILQGGQQYYLITTGVNVARSILILLPSASSIFQVTPATPAIALTSAMACRVFRNLKLEALVNTEVGVLTTMQFGNAAPVTIQLPKTEDRPSSKVDLEQGAMNVILDVALGVVTHKDMYTSALKSE